MTTAHLDSIALPESTGSWFADLLAQLRVPRLQATQAMPVTSVRTLARGELQWVPVQAGGEVRCLMGRLWLTFDRDHVDHFLDAGESFRFTTDRRALVQALQPALFQVQ